PGSKLPRVPGRLELNDAHPDPPRRIDGAENRIAITTRGPIGEGRCIERGLPVRGLSDLRDEPVPGPLPKILGLLILLGVVQEIGEEEAIHQDSSPFSAVVEGSGTAALPVMTSRSTRTSPVGGFGKDRDCRAQKPPAFAAVSMAFLNCTKPFSRIFFSWGV